MAVQRRLGSVFERTGLRTEQIKPKITPVQFKTTQTITSHNIGNYTRCHSTEADNRQGEKLSTGKGK